MKARARTTAPAAREGAARVPMPHQAAMARRFGPRVAHVPVITGPAVAAALAARGADAAALDGAVFLRERTPAPDLVAHEVVHALQQPPAADASPAARVAVLRAAPAAPAAGRAEREARSLGDSAASAQPVHVLPSGVAALRRTGEGAAPAPAPTRAPVAHETSAQAAPPEAVATDTPAAGAASISDVAPTFEPPAMPETALSPEAQAARAAAEAEARDKLAAATTPSAVMDAYATMAPSVKARVQSSLGPRLQDATAADTGTLAENTPAIGARMGGKPGAMPAPPPIAMPGGAVARDAPQPGAPAIVVPEAPHQPEIARDPDYGRQIEARFATSAAPEAVGEAIDDVSTRNPGVTTRVTDRGDVPLEGATDPQRIADETAARTGEAGAARRAAADAVVAGPGPEAVVPRDVAHEAAIAPPATPTLQPLAAAPEAAQLEALALPEEVVASFDGATSAQMEASAASARDQMVGAETERDTAHRTAVDTAETERAAAEQKADADQRKEVGDRRTAIQSERQRTVDAQQAELDAMTAEAETEKRASRGKADAQIAADRAAIDKTYNEAETKAEAKVAEGEQKAAAEKREADRKASQESWWDRAVGFIRRAFEALVSVIGAIFDAVRSAVGAILDLARRAVTAIISLAARALQGLISAFGALLKGLVNNLLGAIFPELAAKLNRFIDAAVDRANSAIQAVADVMIAAVNRIVAALNAAINALLNVFQNALNTAIAFAQAALTGDWAHLLKQVLEAVLRVLGIDPAAFYAMLAQAAEAIGTIVNDPGLFLSRMVDAIVGGIRQFAGNFLGHLKRGIVGWLTGALGDIQLPTEWNLWAVLDLARQILGLTWDFLRERAAKVIGRENVARLESALGWIATLVTEGWAALWQRMQDQLQSLKDTVLGAIKSFLIEKVVMASITWLASLFNPVGAIVKLVMTIWNVYQFIRNQLQRLFGIAQAVIGMLAQIAAGVLGPAINKVEDVLGSLVPVVIDLLMSLLGVTGVAGRVREIIRDVRQSIANAADKLIQKALGGLGLGGGKGGPRNREEAAMAEAGLLGGATPAGVIGRPILVDVAIGADHTLTVERGGAGGATVMLRSTPRPADVWLTELAGRADKIADPAEKRRATENVRSARALLATLDPVADRAAATPAPAAASGRAAGASALAPGTTAPRPGPAAAEAMRQAEQLGPVLARAFDSVPADPAAAGRVPDGDVIVQPFAMNGQPHHLYLRATGGRLELLMASDLDQATRIAESALAEPQTAANKILAKDLRKLVEEIGLYMKWAYDNAGLIASTRKDDSYVDEAKKEAKRSQNALAQRVAEIGQRHKLKDLIDLGHPSKFVLNGEIRAEHRPNWRALFYKTSWSSTVKTWRTTELRDLNKEANTNPKWASNPYVTDAVKSKQVFVVKDAAGGHPPIPYLDLFTGSFASPGNVEIDHIKEVATQFVEPKGGKDQIHSERTEWYEDTTNLQLLNERENAAKGGPTVTDWKVTPRFRGKGEP